MRRAQRGRLALPQAAARVKDAIFNAPPLLPDTAAEPLDEAGVWVASIRNTTLYVAGQAWEALGEGLAEQQEIVAAIADMTATLFALESAWLRVMKSYSKDGEGRDNAIAVVRVYGNDACGQVEQWARYALAAFSAGDTLRTHLATVRRLLKPPAVDTVKLRRQIAESVLSREGYPWGYEL
jgi:alkylation response protein AidB-like acyl-CoA dehydrogenase